MNVNAHIFRSYDIRGTYPDQLNEATAELIGQAYSTYLSRLYKKEKLRFVVGRDNRDHGTSLKKSLIKGMLSRGHDVDQLEDSCSPMLYFAVCQGSYDGGINVTASHNPANYNGCKLLGRDAHSIAGKEIQSIFQMIQDGDLGEEKAPGKLEAVDIEENYRNVLVSKGELQRPLKVVVDAGNGIAGKYYPEVFRALGCEVEELYCEQDGSFPNHEPDPIVEENTNDLKKAVVASGADLGISFDGDGDRLGIVDNEGSYHDANETFVLLIRDILSRHPKTPVIYTVSNSLIVPQEVEKMGGKSVMVAVGHSHVELAMHREGALLGGEQSGHFFVAEDYYGYDDACYTAVKLLHYFAASEKKVSEHYKAIETPLSIPELRPGCDDDKKFAIVAELSEKLQQGYPCNTLDGVRATFPQGGWLGIRASNTSPCLSVCMEASNQEELAEIQKTAQLLLSQHDITI